MSYNKLITGQTQRSKELPMNGEFSVKEIEGVFRTGCWSAAIMAFTYGAGGEALMGNIFPATTLKPELGFSRHEWWFVEEMPFRVLQCSWSNS